MHDSLFAAALSSMAPASPRSAATSQLRTVGSPGSAKAGPALREIDAAGLMVTPGWVDVHTHYDGQAMSDPLLFALMLAWRDDDSFGDCGVRLRTVSASPPRPHRPHGRRRGNPDPVLAEGVPGDGRASPSSSMRSSARRAIDVGGARTPAMRVYVLMVIAHSAEPRRQTRSAGCERSPSRLCVQAPSASPHSEQITQTPDGGRALARHKMTSSCSASAWRWRNRNRAFGMNDSTTRTTSCAG